MISKITLHLFKNVHNAYKLCLPFESYSLAKKGQNRHTKILKMNLTSIINLLEFLSKDILIILLIIHYCEKQWKFDKYTGNFSITPLITVFEKNA